MTVTGPTFIALQVRDVDRAAEFYQTRLGLKSTPVAPPGAVVFDTEPASFAVREPLPGVDLDAARPNPGIGVRCGCTPTTPKPCTTAWPPTASPSPSPRSTPRSGARSPSPTPTATPSPSTTRPDRSPPRIRKARR